MVVYDPELNEIIKEATPVEIDNKQYIIEPNQSGSCEGCSFFRYEADGKLARCPHVAVRYCCSNGGNILREVNDKR